MLVPNGPKERIEYVIRTYRGTKNRRIIPEAVTVSLAMLGFDQAAREFDLAHSPLWHYLWTGEPARLIGRMRADGYLVDVDYDMRPSEEDIEAYVSDVFDRMPATIESMAPGVNNPNPRASLIPWVARELGRLSKAVLRESAEESDFSEAVDLLKLKAPAIAMWAERESIDLSKTSLADAIEAVREYDFGESEGVPQGVVVYSFDDGWTIQDLRTEETLEAEGDEMQHCVGGYADTVRAGLALIYSLRDPRGNPHATIELQPQSKTEEWGRLVEEAGGSIEARLIWGDPTRLVDSPLMKGMKFEQIRGKQNEMPAAKYCEYIQKFINDKLFSSPVGLLMVVMPGQTISFGGWDVDEIDFTNEYSFGGVPLEQADWSEGSFRRCRWPEMEDAGFGEAEISESKFEGDLFGCIFDSAALHSVVFEGALKDCDFEEAQLSQVTIEHKRGDLEVFRCLFRGTDWLNSSLKHIHMSDCDFGDAKLSHCWIIDVTLQRVDFDGIMVNHTRMQDLALSDLNLTEVSRDVTDLLLSAASDVDDVRLPKGYQRE